MNLRQLISFLSIIFLGLASVGAYIPEHLGGKGTRVQKSNLQMEGAILLRENGTPHCRIGKLPSENLGIGLENLDALEECDEGDELYARTILESEEISLGMAAPPGFIKGAEFVWEAGRLAVPMLAIGFLSSCLAVKVDNLLSIDLSDRNLPASQFFGAMIIAGTITVGGIFGGLALVQKAAASRAVGWALGGVGTLSSGTGLLICGDDTELERREPRRRNGQRLQHQDSHRSFEGYINEEGVIYSSADIPLGQERHYHLVVLTEEPWMSEEELELIAEASDISEEGFEFTAGELGISEEKLEFIAEEEGVSKREVAKVLELSRMVLHVERVARDAGLSFEKTKSILYRSCINQAPCFINYPSDLLNNEESPREESNEEESFQRIGGKDVEFAMGNTQDKVKVIFSKAFEIMTTEVTQKMWFDVMKKNPSRFKMSDHCDNHLKIGEEDLCPDHPVEQVSWNDVQTYIQRRNEEKGLTGCRGTPNDPVGCLRLPTEAEWEYAARGGTTTEYFFGDNPLPNLKDYAWYTENSSRQIYPLKPFRNMFGEIRVDLDYARYMGYLKRQTHPVKTKLANPYGLYDMYGNVGEWVQDFWTRELPGGRDPLVVNSNGTIRVVRGGSWFSNARFLRSTSRDYAEPGQIANDNRLTSIGFRLVRNL